MQHFLNPDMVDKKDQIERVRKALIDFGFYHDLVDVTRMYAEYINHHHYGYAGGVLDQPETYWHDMSMMKNLEFYVKELLPFAHETEKIDVIERLKAGGSLD